MRVMALSGRSDPVARSMTGSRHNLAIRRSRAEALRRGFTLVELLVTLGVVGLLIALLTPALGQAREAAQRLSCASNTQGLGSALALYAKDHRDTLPTSYFGSAEVRRPQEMMAATIGSLESVSDGWEGLGHLSTHAGGYVDSDRCFFCPSHRGSHDASNYPNGFGFGHGRCYMNYHYGGDQDARTHRRRRIDEPWSTVFLTDGLRTRSDFNHNRGANRLHGDISVSWWNDSLEAVGGALPTGEIPSSTQVELYLQIWSAIVQD